MPKTRLPIRSIPVRALPEAWLAGEVTEWTPDTIAHTGGFWMPIEYITLYKDYLLIKDASGDEWRQYYRYGESTNFEPQHITVR